MYPQQMYFRHTICSPGTGIADDVHRSHTCRGQGYASGQNIVSSVSAVSKLEGITRWEQAGLPGGKWQGRLMMNLIVGRLAGHLQFSKMQLRGGVNKAQD